MNASQTEWIMALFRKSVLKQQKWKAIRNLLGDANDLRCLDLGADSGVLSYLLRQQGGRWKSADLDARAVESIRKLVITDAFQIDGRTMPFANSEFDRVVIVDILEHIEDDRGFIKELCRIMRPGAEIIINVPHIKPGFLRRFRYWLGQTDERHGHVRPGYTVESLREVLGDQFEIITTRTYSKVCSELVDTLIRWAYDRLTGDHASDGRKGAVVTGDDLRRYKKQFMLYSVIYPFVWLVSQLDRLFVRSEGYVLIVKAKLAKRPAAKAYRRVPAIKANNGRSKLRVIAKGAR